MAKLFHIDTVLAGLCRQPCSAADEVEPQGFHKHECPHCSTVWAHEDMLMEYMVDAEYHKLGHTCPKCGTEQYWKLM